ncbi:acyltransferase domain-containing protein, partial [Kitasatospora sp. NPDC057500]|uniref:acyltransferase domain-containing protein n=1 Tax=Kitasatospora sp. NPDC057500 TaxID=3346151 RepID=UPI00367D61FF
LSAHNETALRAQAHQLDHWLTTHPDTDLTELARTLAHTRTTHHHRAVITATTHTQLHTALTALTHNTPSPHLTHGHPTTDTTRLGFVFTGQGAQWAGMGLDLYHTYPQFAATVDEIAHLANLPLLDILADPQKLNQTANTQIATFTLETALHHLLRTWNIHPDTLAGHSIGEIAAAHAAGILTLPDAVTLVTARGQLMQTLPPGGTMIAIHATEEEIRPHLNDTVCLAAVNGPNAIVISGPEHAVKTTATHFTRTKQLNVSHAFHSTLMNPILEPFAAIVNTLTLHPPHTPLTCNGNPLTPQYWTDHIRQPVRFTDTLTNTHATVLLEIGPDAALTPMIEDRPTIPTQRNNHHQPTTLLKALAQLHTTTTTPIHWPTILNTPTHHLDLPTYPFQHQHYWL